MIIRHILRRIHLYTALIVGFLFAFSGLTGSALVFYQDIDEYLNTALLTVESGSDDIPLSEIVAVAQSVVPAEAKPTRFYFSRHSQAAMKVRFSVPKEDQDVFLDVMVNPFTAEVLGQRVWGGYLMSFLYKLHYTLVLGDAGKMFMGVMGLLLMCSILSGIYLWWPKRSRLFRALTLKCGAKGFRFVCDLHKVMGVYAALVLVVVAFSGVYMIFPQYVKPVVGWFSPLTETAPAQLSAGAEAGARRLDVDEIAKIAHDSFPKAELQRIYFPASSEGVYRVTMRQAGEVRRTSGSTRLWINPYDGKVLAIRKPQTMSSGDTFINWMFPLHNGEAFGLPGRIIVFAAGFVPMILYVTGLMMWWRKRKAGRRGSRSATSLSGPETGEGRGDLGREKPPAPGEALGRVR